MRLSESVARLPIWGESIPGNSGKSKSDIMNIDESLSTEQIFAMPDSVWDKSSEVLGDMVGDATLAWRYEIQEGYAEETYSDVPFLVPYLVPGSERCVISCPGGAYLFKSMDNEGEDIAAFLNAAGISCFVLWYRSYPYKAPYMFLDCQRTVRYVRHHAAEYGIHPDKIATLGFSAGGNLCGVQALCLGDAPVRVEGYVPDAIDRADGRPNAVGMCYPAVEMEKDKALACIAGLDVYQDREKRYAFAKNYDMRTHVHSDAAPVFLCNCMDDGVLPPMGLAELAAAYQKQGVDCELHMFPRGGHGFGGCVERPGRSGGMGYSAASQWKGLFVNWLKRVL